MRDKVLTDEGTALARGILITAREELVRADSKASLLLSAAGVGVGALMAALLAQDWDPHELRNGIEWLWWVGAVAVLVGLIALGYSVIPRTRYRKLRAHKHEQYERPEDLVTYFGDVLEAPFQELITRLNKTADTGQTGPIDQLVLVCGVVRRKYIGIIVGLWCLAGGVLAISVSVIINDLT